MTKTGPGTLTLTGASTNTGPTLVSAGSLIVDGSLGNTAVTVASGAVLAGSGTFGGTVTASAGSFLSPGTVPFTGATMKVANGLTLNTATVYCDLSDSPAGANDRITITAGPLTYAGTPTFQFLLLGASLAAGNYDLITAPSSVVPGGTPGDFPHNLPTGTRQTFTVKRTGSTTTPARLWLEVLGDPATLRWTGATSANWDATTADNWTGATPNIFGANDAVIFDDSSPVRTVTLTGSLKPRSVVINTASAYTLAGTGTLDGEGSLVKNGPGTLWLAGTGVNTFSGGFTLNAGTVAFQTDDTSNATLGGGPVTLNGGTLTMFSDFSSYDNLTAALVVPTGATATLNADARVDIYGTLSGGGTLNLFIPSNRTSIFSNCAAFTGVLNALTASGYAELRMSQAYNPSGFPNTTVNLGENVVAVFTGNINQGAGTTIPIGALAGAATSRLLGGPDFAGARLVTYRIGGTGADTVFAGRILEQNAAVNNTSIVKTGAGIWTLSGSGTWNGGTTVEQGTLKITGAFTCASATNVLPGATLSLLGGSLASDAVNIAPGAQCIGHGTITGDLNNDGTVTVGTGSALTVTGDAVNNGTMRLTGGSGLVTSGSFVNNGILDLLTSSSDLPANFENNGIVIDSTAMHVLQATKVGSSVTLTVHTYAGHNYQLQLAASMTGPWSDVAGQAFAGNGNLRNFTDSAANSSQRFYRVAVSP